MLRIRFSERSVSDTTSTRFLDEIPKFNKRCSSKEGSGPVHSNGSPNTVETSRKSTLCFSTFACSFIGIPCELHESPLAGVWPGRSSDFPRRPFPRAATCGFQQRKAGAVPARPLDQDFQRRDCSVENQPAVCSWVLHSRRPPRVAAALCPRALDPRAATSALRRGLFCGGNPPSPPYQGVRRSPPIDMIPPFDGLKEPQAQRTEGSKAP